MNPAIILSCVIAAAVVGAAVAWAIGTTRIRGMLADARTRLAESNARSDERERDNVWLRQRVVALSGVETECASLRAQLDAERSRAAEKIALLERAESRLRESFHGLSAQALRDNNDGFLTLAMERLQPIRDSLEKVETSIHEVELAREGAYYSLVEQVRAMATSQEKLRSTAQGLRDALRSPHVRGRWGEIQLKRVCEMAGMLEHCDFVEQESVDTPDGKLRPDVIVKLPGGKLVVVDSKAPLQAYLESVDAPDEVTREARLRDHARQVRDHMTKLGAKSYSAQFEEAPEFVVMFLPGESFFSAALQYDPGLIEYGVAEKVILATPTTLISLLRSVAYGWQQDRIARNAEEISALGRELYERLRVFAGHYTEMRRSLEKTVESYNKSVGSLERSVFPQARRFRELGAAASAPELTELEEVGVFVRTLDVENASSVGGLKARSPMALVD